MKKVIGGEFSIPCLTKDQIYKDEKQFFSSGRGAFASILRTGIKKVLLPNYLCSSITKVYLDEKISYEFYCIDDNLLPDEYELMSKITSDCAVLLISYFGIISVLSVAKKIKVYNPNSIVIVDDVQNFFSNDKSEFVDFRFNSYRKWFSVPDGAEVFCNSQSVLFPTGKNSFAQYKFSGNVLKNYANCVDDRIFLDLLETGEKLLEDGYNCECSDIGKLLISQIPYENVRKIRMRNATFLHEEL